MSFLNELKRRNVLRVAAAYVVTAWLIVQVVETLFPIYGLSDAAVRVVVNVLAIGIVPVLVFSWVFEWTPQGLKLDSEVADDAPSSIQAAKRLDRVILLVLALALGYFAFDKFVLAPQQMAEEVAEAREEGRSEAIVESFGDQSIAVLAFADLSPEGDQEYFSDGVAEEILNLLAAIPELRVISRSSAFTYKGKDMPIPQIARELSVAHVLEGSVRKAGNQVRVTAQLIDARSDTHLWSQTWDRTLDNIFAIQDEIAADVVSKLKIQLAGAVPTSRRTDPEVYSLTLQAKRELEFMQEGFEDRIASLLERALILDPNYVPALETAILADILFWSSRMSKAELDSRYAQWRNRILETDPQNGVIRGYDAWDMFLNQGDVEGAAHVLQEVLNRHPNDTEVLRSTAGFLRRIGKYDQALPIVQQCVRLDPLRVTCLHLMKNVYLDNGQLDKAYEYMQRIRVLWNEPIRAHDVLLLIMRGDGQGAVEMLALWPDSWQKSALHSIAAYILDDVETYRVELAKFLASEELRQDEPNALLTGAGIYAYTGDADEAFRWLDRVADTDEREARFQLFVPDFQPLHNDPRWTVLRERLGMSTDRLGAVEFQVPKTIPPAEDRLGLD